MPLFKFLPINANPSSTSFTNREDFYQVLSALVGEALNSVYLHPVTFKMVFKPLDLRDALDYIEDSDIEIEAGDGKLLRTYIAGVGYYTIFEDLRNVESIRFFSECERDCFKNSSMSVPDSDFSWTVENTDKYSDNEAITFGRIVEACYRLKSSKYDNGYELFSGLNFSDTPKNRLEAEVCFGYGN